MEFKKKEHRPIISLILKILKKFYKKGVSYYTAYTNDIYVVVYSNNVKVKRLGNGSRYLFYIDLTELKAYEKGANYLSGYRIICDDDFKRKGFRYEYPLLEVVFRGDNIYIYDFLYNGKKEEMLGIITTDNVQEMFFYFSSLNRKRMYVELIN